MPFTLDLLNAVSLESPGQAWDAVAEYLWAKFSAPLPDKSDGEVVNRDRAITELENVLAGACWDLWHEFDAAVPKASRAVIDFWKATHNGKAVLILDGLSLRETPWLLEQAKERGYSVAHAGAKGAELPGETTPFANALGFSQRSALENNGAGKAHQLGGATTDAVDLPWRDCIDRLGNAEGVVFWHHWPDSRMHGLSKPGDGLRALVKETHARLTSDDFWAFVDRLATGRRLVITSDHGYAACGLFSDLDDKDQQDYMKRVFKNGRCAPPTEDGGWVPPIDLKIESAHGTRQMVLGRRKWKSPSGYPTLHHGGLSLLEVFVPFIELRKSPS